MAASASVLFNRLLARAREPAVLPQGWRFSAVREDCFVVVCDPDHPLARRQRLTLAGVKGETWLLAPVTSAARRAFDALALDRGWDVRSCETVTRVTPLVCAILARQRTLAMVPASAVGQFVEAGQLVVLPITEPLPLEPLGLLTREQGGSEAATCLGNYLTEWGEFARTTGGPE